jgi:hypothetical protein
VSGDDAAFFCWSRRSQVPPPGSELSSIKSPHTTGPRDLCTRTVVPVTAAIDRALCATVVCSGPARPGRCALLARADAANFWVGQNTHDVWKFIRLTYCTN